MNGVGPQANGDSSKVKVKIRININGLFNVSGATITEKVEKPETTEEQEPMDVDNNEPKAQEAGGASVEANESQQQSVAEEGTGDSPKVSPKEPDDLADVEPTSKDAADKVRRNLLNLLQYRLLSPPQDAYA